MTAMNSIETLSADTGMAEIGVRARAASAVLALASPESKNAALEAASAAIREDREVLLAANAEDVAEATARGLRGAMIDRLVHHAQVISLKGDSYRLKDRDLGRLLTD